jgi:hypothetical protein
MQDPMDSHSPAPVSNYLMVVQRDDEERYQLLRKLFQGQRVEVVRDRRTGDRRTGDQHAGGAAPPASPTAPAANRRAGERRGRLPDTWVNLGFFVARRHNGR